MAYIGIACGYAGLAASITTALTADDWCRGAVRAHCSSVDEFDTYRRQNAWPTVDLLITDFPSAKSFQPFLNTLRERFPRTHIILVTRASQRYATTVEGATFGCIAEQKVPEKLATLVQEHILATRDR